MLKQLFILAISSLIFEQINSIPTASAQKPITRPIMRQHAAEVEIAKALLSIRLANELHNPLKQVPPSDSELQLTCTAALTDQKVHDPELGNLETYITSDLTSQPEYLKLVALGTSDFQDGKPRHPVYSDKNWPRYSVVVFMDKSSTPEHTVYRVGVARRPSVFMEWIAPITGDNPIQDVKDWKKQVIPACQHAK